MFNTRKKGMLIVTVLVVVLILPACNSQMLFTELTIGIAAEPVKLDPHNSGDGASFYVYDYMLEGLVGWDRDSKLAPALATSWEFSEGGIQFIAYLRKGVTFHDGTDFNSQAVKVNFDRIIDSTLKLIAYSAFKDIIDSVDIIDDYTVKFNLKKPHASFVYDLAGTYAKIISPSLVDRTPNDVAVYPVGTGPFKFVEWVPGERIIVDAYDNYWEGRPELDRIVFKPIPEETSRVAAVEAGNVDVILGFPLQDLERLQESCKLQVLTNPCGLPAYHFQLNMRKEPLTDIRVRHALNYAIDKETIVRTVYRGLARSLDSPLGPGVPAHTTVGTYEYNPDKARELLAKAGYSEGLRLVLWTGGKYLMDLELCEAVANYLEDVGIDVEIVSMDWATYLAKIRSPSPDAPPEYDLALLSAAPGNGDADMVWRLMIDSNAQPPDGVNLSFYSNPEVDALIQKELTIFDEEERNAVHAEIQEIVWNDAPWLFLVMPYQVAVMSKDIKGAYYYSFGLVLKDASLGQFLTGVYSTFDFHYDVVELYVRVVKEEYSGMIYDIEIFPEIQSPAWDSVEALEAPEGWNFEKVGKGVRFYTETNPLLKCQPVKFKFKIEGKRISWYIRVHVTDEAHGNLGMIISTRWRLYHFYLM